MAILTCPLGRMSEEGPIPDRYCLQETKAKGFLTRTPWNVRDSDATVIFTMTSVMDGGSLRTRDLAEWSWTPLCLQLERPRRGAEALQTLLSQGTTASGAGPCSPSLGSGIPHDLRIAMLVDSNRWYALALKAFHRHLCNHMASNSSRSHQTAHRNDSIAQRAVDLLAVDDIKLSERGRELLSMCEAGIMTFDQAREDIIARAKLMAEAHKKCSDIKR